MSQILPWSLAFVFLLLTTILLLYKYFTRNFDYWKKRGVFYFEPIPFFGNFYDILTFKTTIAHGFNKLYLQTNEAYFGAFMMNQPILIVRSPELIENILVKDFPYFKNRNLACPKHNQYVSNFLAFQRYKAWKKTRNKVNYIFTTGKLKGMLLVSKTINDIMVNYLSNKSVIDAYDLACNYSTEVTVRCYFGINSHCFENKRSKILEIANRLFKFSLRNAVVQGAYLLKPDWVDLFKMDFINTNDQNYMIQTFIEILETRQANKRNGVKVAGNAKDYIDILLDTKENENLRTGRAGFVEVIANALQFFLAGAETMRSVQSFTMYELAIYPDVQDKLRKEVVKVATKYKGVTFESLQEMKYLECCLYETIRRYVSFPILDRQAVEDYPVPGSDLIIEKGTTVFIPFYSIHMDEKYFSEPNRYNPDRFLDIPENKYKLTFLPFGAGPRGCVGERFAMTICKSMIATLVLSYELSPCDKTPIPIEFETKSFTFQSKTGLPVRIKPLGGT